MCMHACLSLCVHAWVSVCMHACPSLCVHACMIIQTSTLLNHIVWWSYTLCISGVFLKMNKLSSFLYGIKLLALVCLHKCLYTVIHILFYSSIHLRSLPVGLHCSGTTQTAQCPSGWLDVYFQQPPVKRQFQSHMTINASSQTANSSSSIIQRLYWVWWIQGVKPELRNFLWTSGNFST